MPVIAKFHGIVVRMLTHQTFGMHFHAFYGDSEIVIGLNPLRIIQGDAPAWVRECVLDWVRQRRTSQLSGRQFYPVSTSPSQS